MQRTLLILLLLSFIISCKKEYKVVSSQQNMSYPITDINQVRIDFITQIDSNKSISIIYNFDSLKVLSTNTPFFADTWYDCNVHFFTVDSSRVIERTNEVIQDGSNYQYFFWSPNASIIDSFQYKNNDLNGMPIGTEFRLKTSTRMDTFSIKGELQYQLNKNMPSVLKGNNDSANGTRINYLHIKSFFLN